MINIFFTYGSSMPIRLNVNVVNKEYTKSLKLSDWENYMQIYKYNHIITSVLSIFIFLWEYKTEFETIYLFIIELFIMKLFFEL